MQKNENQSKRIYLKDLHKWVEVSDDFYNERTRYYDTFRKRCQSHGQCACPKNKFWLCDGDCYNCEFHRAGDLLSLDYPITDSDGNEKEWLEDLPDESPSIQSILEDRELLDSLYQRLDELDPDGRLICELVMQGCPERTAAAKLGLSRNTFTYRRDKLLALLREALRDYI